MPLLCAISLARIELGNVDPLRSNVPQRRGLEGIAVDNACTI